MLIPRCGGKDNRIFRFSQDLPEKNSYFFRSVFRTFGSSAAGIGENRVYLQKQQAANRSACGRRSRANERPGGSARRMTVRPGRNAAEAPRHTKKNARREIMENRICSLFGIRYPIVAGGMIWCSGWRLSKFAPTVFKFFICLA